VGSVSKAADGAQLRSSSATATKTTSSLSERPASTSSDTSTTVQADNVFDAATPCSSKVIVNELLTYVQFYRDRSTVESLHKLVISFYLPSEITEAKRLVIDEFSAESIDCSLKTVRRHSGVRTAHDAEAEDNIGKLPQ